MKYIVGIDLGTTNSAMAAIGRRRKGSGEVEHLPVLQRVSETQVADRRTLPSFLYLPGEHELPAEALALPWTAEQTTLVGEFARVQGARIPPRLVSSAKSWLCHPRADRTAPILPWDAPPGVARVSPLEASARYLAHLRDAWDFKFGKEARLQEQDVVLTVPASFNEVARELTVQAANLAGLANLTLLEEPQAAFYSWLERHRRDWSQLLGGRRGILVCDIGGGTTDFTLIQVAPGDPPVLRRVAVGEHLMLGGDNMDLALAHVVEQALGARYDSRNWGILVHECRHAKERLLAPDAPDSWTVSLPGSGSKLLAGMTSASLLREEVEQIVLEGFFPLTDYADVAVAEKRPGLVEWGLPYASEPAVSRHLAAFLQNQCNIKKAADIPDVVLFNGAALEPRVLRERILDLLQQWSGHRPLELENRELDLAVARGAAYSGWLREVGGQRIVGGIARSYYVGVASDRPLAACLIPRGLEEGQEIEIKQPEFRVVVDRPVAFPLYASTVRAEDAAGALVTLSDEQFESLPPLATILGTRPRHEDEEETPEELPVHLRARVTEIGTLELWCVGREEGQRWKLQFQVRSSAAASPRDGVGTIAPTEDRAEVRRARSLIVETFRTRPGRLESASVKPRGVMWAVEEILRDKRDHWSLPLLRQLWEALDRVKARRRSSESHEGPWLNACGFCLRPGYGYPLDDWRLQRTWETFEEGLQYPRSPTSRVEWWVMWRRLAGGLDAERQAVVFGEMAPYLLPGRKHVKTRLGSPEAGTETAEFWRLAASLERLDVTIKIALGETALRRLEKRPSPLDYWMLARLGTRVPLAASPHYCVPPAVAEGWMGELVDATWKDVRMAGFALCQMGRLTGDRTRDLAEEVRERAADRLANEALAELARPLRELVEMGAEDQATVVGESLPVGLKVGGT